MATFTGGLELALATLQTVTLTSVGVFGFIIFFFTAGTKGF